jgi:YVTN family beta-propeller protein
MGGRRGPPDGGERPLRGLPGGRARPPPPGGTPPEDDRPDQQAPEDGDRPGLRAPDDRTPPEDGSGGVVRPLRPLRVVPGAGAPPLRVIPGGAQAGGSHAGGSQTGGAASGTQAGSQATGTQAPTEPTNGDGHRGASVRALVTAPAQPLPVPPARRRAAPRRRWLAAVLVLVLLTGLAVAGRVVAERPGTSTASTAAATTAASGPPTAGRPSPVVATVGTGGFSYDMVAGAGAVWVVGSDEVTRIDPATNSVTARVPVAATGSGPAAVAVGAGAVWVPVAVPAALWGIDPGSNKVMARIPLGGPLRGSISVSAAGDTVWVACCGQAGSGSPTSGASGGRLLRVDPHRKRVVADIHLPANPAAVAADATGAWVATADGQVLVVSRKRNRVVAAIDAGGPLGFSQTIAVGASGVWLADPFDEQVVRIEPKSRRVMARVPAGAVTTLAVAPDAVWALSSLGLVRVDPGRNRVTAVAPDPDLRRARFVAADGGAVWTAGWSSVSRIDPDRVRP